MLRDVLDLVGAAWHTGWYAFGRILTALLLIPACIVMFFFMVARLDLSGGTVLLVGLAWIAACLVGIIMTFNPNKVATSILTIIGIFLAITTVTHMTPKIAPGTSAAVSKIARYGDKKAKLTADKMVLKTRHAIGCNSATVGQFDWFATDEENGELVPLMWYAEIDGRIECFDGPGHDSRYGRELSPVSESTVRRIGQQEPPRTVAVAQPAPPLPVAAPAEPVMGAEQTIIIPRPTS